MIKRLSFIFALFIMIAGAKQVQAQGGDISPEDLKKYKERVSELVSYYEGTLNFLGNPKSIVKEKEVIINESYLKIFKDDKVQVEDDLDESREVPLHKDVQAYLKDIEFFFRSVSFKFIVSEITFNTNENNLNYFRVTLNRDIQGITVNGDTISNRKVRFMEVNLDDASSDLRIASIYTTKLNVQEEKRIWWNGLPVAWRDFFGSRVTVYDSLMLSDVRYISDSLILVSGNQSVIEKDTSSYYDIELPPGRTGSEMPGDLDTLYVDKRELFTRITGILKQTRIDISGNEQIRLLDPLSKMSDLVDVNCSNTLIMSVAPLRNLNHLEVLSISNTPIEEVNALQYSTSLKSLDCSYTLVDSLMPVSRLYNIEKLSVAGLRINDPDFISGMTEMTDLNLSETGIHDLSGIAGLTRLQELDVSGTGIHDLETVRSFPHLKYLNAEGTSVSQVGALSGLQELEVLKISYTAVEDINPLFELPALKRIYWDSNGEFPVDKKKKRDQAIEYMNTHPGTLVIFESEDLINSWADLEEPWKEIARNVVKLSEDPTREELHTLLQVEEIRIDTIPVTTLEPVARLYNLKRLSVPGLQVQDFSPVGQAIELEELDVSNTPVQTLDFAKSLKHLTILNIEGTPVRDLTPLEGLTDLKFVYADRSGVTDEEANKLREQLPECIILFRTEDLTKWWDNLPESWKSYFVAGFSLHSPPSKEQLHRLYYLDKLEIDGNRDIASLEPAGMLVNLRSLKLNEIGTGDLQPLTGLKELKELQCTRVSVNDLTPLSSLDKLEVLDLENTPVDDLKPLASLVNLRHVDISGTQVSNLKPLKDLHSLETVELNNTQVKSISPLESLPSLKSVSCFNTRISSKTIEKFKERKPACKVVYY